MVRDFDVFKHPDRRNCRMHPLPARSRDNIYLGNGERNVNPAISSYQKDGVFRRLCASSSSSLRLRFVASVFAKDSFRLEISSLFADVDDPVVATTAFRSSLGRYGHANTRSAMAKAAIKVLKSARESTLRGIASLNSRHQLVGPLHSRDGEADRKPVRVDRLPAKQTSIELSDWETHILLALRSQAHVRLFAAP